MRRIFLGSEVLKNGKFVYVFGETAHYILDVLRLKKRQFFTGFDGSGKEYKIEIVEIVKNKIKCEIIEEKKVFSPETEFSLALFQCIPKGNKMDFVVRGAAQLGVKKIVPVISKRVVVKISDEKVERKILRWRKIATESSKVSGRNFVPEIGLPVRFEEAVREEKDYGIIFWEGEREFSLKEVLKKFAEKVRGAKINAFVGPEGGFDEEEIKIAKENGFYSVSLGKRILKVETASTIAMAILIYEFE